MMQEAEDEPLFADRAAGIDIAKAGIEVTIRVPSDTRRRGRQQETRSFRTTRKELLALADWLRCWQVTKVGMESTGDYWKPVYFLLEAEGLDCVLYHAAQVKALPGRPNTDKHAAVRAMMLPPTEHYTAGIEELTGKIEVLCQPYLHQIEQLDAVPGTGVITAQDIIAEIGTDMTVFPTAAHLVSWAKWCPQVAQSGGKRKGANASGRGNPYLSAALGEISISAARTQSFLGARYRRLVRRMPKKKALVATGSSVLTIFHALLSDPAATYHDLGADYYEQRMNARRQARTHVRGLERLGRVAPVHCCTGAPSGPRMRVVPAHGPSKPQGRFRCRALARCHRPAAARAAVAGGRWRV